MSFLNLFRVLLIYDYNIHQLKFLDITVEFIMNEFDACNVFDFKHLVA